MAKKKITEIAAEMMADFLAAEGYELYNIEFVKEGKDWFLRVYVDMASGEGYIGTEDCEKVSRFLSEKLDEEDPIEQNYYLEVSSPGMDRPLLTKAHYERYVGSEVEIRLYKGKDGTKNIQGVLDSIEGETVTVTDHDNKKWELELAEIAKANLAVIF
ncbi:MAG: ribosome maturation factor RimP [Firmicutes bacterium]|nr:ribosome maturation factor RimP [Bacillota bacterium]